MGFIALEGRCIVLSLLEIRMYEIDSKKINGGSMNYTHFACILKYMYNTVNPIS